MDAETELAIKNISAHLCAVEAAVCALIAASPDRSKLAKFLDSSVSGMLASPAFSKQPERRYFQQCLDRLRAGLSTRDVPAGRK